ncbi:unnamed protein product [Cuscuta europaea]|uniref:Uncharacterized protein n=1 Tax=Cuscuta europaea TaxID=41803 RepID=A0A9P0ZRS5_CUSEU|nr:unnamed protein product [Cuscuta europaea]
MIIIYFKITASLGQCGIKWEGDFNARTYVNFSYRFVLFLKLWTMKIAATLSWHCGAYGKGVMTHYGKVSTQMRREYYYVVYPLRRLDGLRMLAGEFEQFKNGEEAEVGGIQK